MIPLRWDKRGFTLVELLVVIAMFGIFAGAIYSLYIAQMKTAFTREEVVDVQQNVRVAMDRLTHDIMMTGFLVPPTASGRFVFLVTRDPVTNAQYTNYSSVLRLRTASADASFIKLATEADTTGATTFGPLNVTPAVSLNRFAGGDPVRIIRPLYRTQPINSVFSVLTSNRATGTVTINNNPAGTAFTAGISFRSGDVICKVDSMTADYPETVMYSITPCEGTTTCLARSVNGGPAAIIAQNIRNVNFSYLLDDGTETNNAPIISDEDKLSTLRAIRVTVTGQTYKKSSTDEQPKTRQLTSVVKIRNRR